MPDAVFVGTLPLEVCHMLMNNPEYSTHLASTERLNSTDRGKNVARANSLLGSQLMALQDMTKTREREMFARHDPAMISRNQVIWFVKSIEAFIQVTQQNLGCLILPRTLFV